MKFNSIDFNKIENDASNKKIYRSKNEKDAKILVDFSYNHNDYLCFLEVYDYLTTINISIPKIFDFDSSQHIIIMEDFGNIRYDKIIDSIDLKKILLNAIDSLIQIQNTKKPIVNNCLKKYNLTIFNEELSEFIDFYFPLKNISEDVKDEFLHIWQSEFENLNFDWNSFVHKDFELTNLIYLPQREGHLKCGILDFQSAYIGFAGWDVFSLLENPRIYFDDKYNEELVEYFFKNINQTMNFKEFLKQYYFLNTARQTRIIGRWINLDKQDKKNNYSKYLNITIRRLNKSLHNLHNEKLSKLYNKILDNE